MAHSRSYVDPIAIRFVIPEIEVESYLNEFIGREFPIDYLTSFLHECSHHFCLNSPLGLAFSLLNLDNRLKISNSVKKGRDYKENIGAIYRYSYTLNLLRPLLEGIALFTEHDVRAGGSKTLSRQLGFIQFLFGTKKAQEAILENGEKGLDGFINQTLDDARLTTKQIDKKSSLYLTPLVSPEGGHLLGYLSIKSIFAYCYAMSPSDYTADPDLFVQFFSTYIFEDWRLVELILDEKKDVSTGLNEIIKHIQLLLHQYLKLDHTKVLTDYQLRNNETCSDNLSIELKTFLYRIDLYQKHTEEYSITGKNLLTNYLKRVMNAEKLKKNPLKDLAAFHHAIILNNQAMCVGNASFRGFKIVKGWIDLVGKNGRCDFQFEIESLLPKNWDGWIHIDLIAFPADFKLVVALVANDKVIHIINMENNSISGMESHLHFLYNHYMCRSLYHSKMDDYNEATNNILGNLDISTSNEIIKIIYHPYLSIFMNPEKDSETIANMENNFAQMLGSFADCVDVAELTLRISAYIDSRLSGEFITKVISVNERLKKTFGYLPFTVFPDGRLFSLI